MGILRVNTVSGIETATPVTGSVSFTGVAGTHLSISTSTDFSFQNADFTIEFWMNTPNNKRGVGVSSQTPFAINANQCRIGIGTSGSTAASQREAGRFYFTYAGNDKVTTLTCPENQWTHIALVRQNSVIKLFKDGVPDNTNVLTDSTGNTNGILTIGSLNTSGDGAFLGFISNLRIRRGTAGYTTNFTPPIYELEPIQDTVLLCCQSGVSTTSLSFAGIGSTVSDPKVIIANGSVSASSTSPGLVRNYTFGTQFGGVSKFDTFGYFVPPSGTTEQRFPNFPGVSAASARGVFAGGIFVPSTNHNIIDFVTISTTGNAQDFGDLTVARNFQSAFSSSTRGIVTGGNPSSSNLLEYVTIASTGNAVDFGDALYIANPSGLSNSTRGIFAGGESPVSPNPVVNTINYVTIATTGNAFDFGDLLVAVNIPNASSSSTRGIFSGGSTGPASTNTIQFITIASTGNAVDFGDLTISIGKNASNGGSCSSGTRALYPGGISGPARINSIDYITIASLGNAVRFGDLTSARDTNPCSSTIRGIFGGGGFPTSLNTIDQVTIATTGNATSFGELTQARSNSGSFSNGHGGLG